VVTPPAEAFPQPPEQPQPQPQSPLFTGGDQLATASAVLDEHPQPPDFPL
jgi:hypothetical protein